MGNQSVTGFRDAQQKRAFTKHLLNDIRALEWLLEHDGIERDVYRIGAEQELVIVGKDYRPAMKNMAILEELDERWFTTEIAKFNLEINLDPQPFSSGCLHDMQGQLDGLLKQAKAAAERNDARIMLTGILPTISRDHLDFDHMTPNVRYEALNQVMRDLRGDDFELYIVGVDELKARHSNILFEACNTSFQVHMQLSAEEFTERYNWSQLIAAPVLAASANSPILLGKRLWSETRIALFQQSVDTRNASTLAREVEPRVSFGREWLRGTVADLYKDNVSRFNLLFASDINENSLDVARNGGMPDLDALKLHNGTVYRWNRACFGKSNGKAHLRIENRYIPAGPTTKDEMANAAFWLGLMSNKNHSYGDITERMSFEDVRFNFYNAARTCLDASFQWFGRKVSAADLVIDEMLPMAAEGLRGKGLKDEEYMPYLELIQARAERQQNGSKWIQRNFTAVMAGSTPAEAAIALSKAIDERESQDIPVHDWDDLDVPAVGAQKRYETVAEVMTTDVFTVQEDELVDLVISMMDWKNIRYIPVENKQHEIVGMVTYKTLLNYFIAFSMDDNISVQDIMLTDFSTVDQSCATSEAIGIMAREHVSCIPVVNRRKLVGIITESDIVKIADKTGKFKA